MGIIKKILSRYFPAVPVGAVLASVMFSHSCANTTTPPSGGPKDTIPPVIVKLYPPDGATMVPVHKTQLSFTFDEYVVVKERQNILLSPPQAKAPLYKIKGKSVVISFDEDLDSNRTYTLDLTNAIADNNEGNMFPGLTLAFSTGAVLDSMMLTGSVYDCNTLMPVKGATVMLYKYQGDSTVVNDTLTVPSDSAVFLKRPDAAAKTDDWGFFCVRNIEDTLYRMYAILEESPNNIYDPDNDRVAFIDSLVRPVTVVDDSLPEVIKYLMTDTLACLARKSEYEMNLFKETPSKQMIVNSERIGERTAYITFMAPYAEVDSIWIRDVPSDRLITQFNLERDSLEIWVNDPSEQPDTLFLNVSYMKTDTLGQLSPFIEEVKLTKPRKTAAAKSARRDIKKEDTTTVFTITAEPETVEQYGFLIEFKYPLVESAFDSLEFRYLNPRQQESTGKYTVEQDSLNLRKYVVRPVEKLMPGYEYFLKVPARKFMDINGFYNDSSEVKVMLPNDDKLSSLSLVLSNVKNKYIVDLLTEKRDKVVRSFIIENDCTLLFPYITAGKYCIRITEDLNRNGLVDTGNILERKQPEKVKFYRLDDGTFLIDIPEMTELQQNIDLGELFK
ncbi:MAG: Ig-like domain-containing protein [Bacteroidetes bacterium]|uniref:Ig-like domain-containing protein n=1 Tax=Candidatus Cryptobacteroides intestinavium TaxID=2840766 RepID=A0A9D9EQU2_9BACT|nr:Ig-like domain-containing protein [Candidatus Cryptobacteroides intestinavium]